MALCIHCFVCTVVGERCHVCFVSLHSWDLSGIFFSCPGTFQLDLQWNSRDQPSSQMLSWAKPPSSPVPRDEAVSLCVSHCNCGVTTLPQYCWISVAAKKGWWVNPAGCCMCTLPEDLCEEDYRGEQSSLYHKLRHSLHCRASDRDGGWLDPLGNPQGEAVFPPQWASQHTVCHMLCFGWDSCGSAWWHCFTRARAWQWCTSLRNQDAMGCKLSPNMCSLLV